MRNGLNHNMKRLLVAILAIAFIVVRAVLPNARLDEISLALFVIVCLAILWSDLGKIARLSEGFVSVALS